MPDAAATDTKGASAEEDKNLPDLVGEELADSARIWRVYDCIAKEDDERRTKEWDSGLNNLALFAGLFSAVTTSFIIEARHDMEPDYAQLTFLAVNATSYREGFVVPPFVIPTNARTVTCLWVASLILSLSAALIAIMGKDWIGMYTVRPDCNLRQWAEMRAYRLRCVERWYMPGVIAAAPVLLHVSLILFGVGLVLFISSDPFTHRLTLGLSSAAGILYLGTTLGAVVFSASPFKSPATQAARTTLSALYSYISTASKSADETRRTDETRHIDETTSLPGGAPENVQWHIGLRKAVVGAGEAGIAYMRAIPAWVRTQRNDLQLTRVRSWASSMASSARQLTCDLFLSSTWTDLPADRRPELLAEALSRLSGASEAPDVFRAIVFALGDLDIGPDVGKYTSLTLRTRLRAEICRTWQQVDFLTLSHYVLADRNTPDDPVLVETAFRSRFTVGSALRCEHGIAAYVKISGALILPDRIVDYFPDEVAQPRMPQFLLSCLLEPSIFYRDVLILLSNRYRKHLWTTDSFSLSNLEAHLRETLDPWTRDRYDTAVKVEYGGTSGAIELLTFLCCHALLSANAKAAAVELVMELLEHSIFSSEHRCLAYLFGSKWLWDVTWNKHWLGLSIFQLSRGLAAPFVPDDWQYELAVARAVVMAHSRQFRWDHYSMKILYDYLRQSPSPSFPDIHEWFDVICLVLKHAALLQIVGWPLGHSAAELGIAILAAIIRDVGGLLRDPETIFLGAHLFKALAHTEVEIPDGETYTWDLGEWLRAAASDILSLSSDPTAAIEDVHDALSALYPLCEHNSELRPYWDRIGYPGRHGDIFSNPFLDLNIGEFFASAEDPLSRSGIYDCFDSEFWGDIEGASDNEERADDEERAPDDEEQAQDDEERAPDDRERDPDDEDRSPDDEDRAPDDQERELREPDDEERALDDEEPVPDGE